MLVGVDAAVLFFSGHGLSQVVRERQKHESVRIRHFVTHGRRPVEHFHGVCPDIAFRVEYRILLQAYKGLELREPCVELVHFAELLEEDGRSVRFEEGLFEFFFHALF